MYVQPLMPTLPTPSTQDGTEDATEDGTEDNVEVMYTKYIQE